MSSTPTGQPKSPETTELERRVLAHERILQSLIAYMSQTEPRFVDHLRARFVEPMAMSRHEQDYRDVDDYAEEFIRAIMRLGEASLSKGAKEEADGRPGEEAEGVQPPTPLGPAVEPERVQLQERGGVWELTVDGVFRGDYHLKEQGIAAAALAKLSLQ